MTDLSDGAPVYSRALEEELPIPGVFLDISRFDQIEPGHVQAFEMPCVIIEPFSKRGRFRIVFTYVSPVPEKMKIRPDIAGNELGRVDSNAEDVTVE